MAVAIWVMMGVIMSVMGGVGAFGFHIWRQAFPNGSPEQVTSGPSEEEGIAMAPDGKSFITSVGLATSTVWVHDGKGDRGQAWCSEPSGAVLRVVPSRSSA